MVKTAFVKKLGLSVNNYKQLETINSIIVSYQKQGYKLTLRQLYYQLVSRGLIPNKVQEYAKLSTLLTKGRMAGVVDWEAIEDRLRRPYLPYWVIDVADALTDTIDHYRLNRQEDQKVYVEVWVEKDALSGVLKRITGKYHVNLMVNRGYSSTTAMYDAYVRISTQQDLGKKCYILYLGDHDPSGLDMVRDIRERLETFGVSPEVKAIALTSEQVAKYNPPPNPAKFSDPRATWYINKFGATSWEVDALPPEVLNTLLVSEIEALIDMDKYRAKISKEDYDKATLKGFIIDYNNKGNDSDNDDEDEDDDLPDFSNK